jgi:transposase
VAEIAAHHEVHPDPVTSWKAQLLENVVPIFGDEAQSGEDREKLLQELHAKIGELTVERELLESALEKSPGLSSRR